MNSDKNIDRNVEKNGFPHSEHWYGKPYFSLDAYCKNTLGEKVYKIALDAGMTCPNRDGSIDTRGCIFCSAGGSGEFAVAPSDRKTDGKPDKNSIRASVQEQIITGTRLFEGRQTTHGKLSRKHTGHRFIAYFQSYTNTYAPVAYLKVLYDAALSEPCISGISIATRPDCVSLEICDMLDQLRQKYPDKFIWIELGLQTIHESTAVYIRRGYPLSRFDRCMQLLHEHHIPAIIHVILGLPGETADMIMETIQYLNHCNIQGIKLQLLHVLKGTDLCTDYELGKFHVLSMDTYLDLVMECLSILSPDMVIHRLTGDGSKSLLVAPLWSSNKRLVLNTLHKEMKQRNITQGCAYRP
ncbi:MAG: TIGR01212 family radical SAM protein [Lachnospiraceae bacterium]|nr:TIGR01212 family radical SAM protein [Lachnospiraceae bacterium]